MIATSRDLPLFVARSRPLAQRAQLEAHLDEHLTYMNALEAERVLFASGPFTDGAFGEGLTILRAPDADGARRILDADPFVALGLRDYELRAWRVKEGTL